MTVRLSPRQVHLDFHTSELIEGIGSRFSKENFQKALKLGHLSSITVFAKCHHSWCYYPTEVGMRHPHLTRDLLGEQIAAAHEIGVRAPIYITMGWSANDAQMHPEWVAREKDGTMSTTNYDLSAGPEDRKPMVSWKNLCLVGGYKQHVLDITQEICEKYPVDGIFYDICFHGEPCYCASCRRGMQAMGLDPEKEADARKYYVLKRQEMMDDCRKLIFRYNPEATVFFNGGATQRNPQYHGLQTHFEMEDLPTTWGGYDKMPPRAKFFSRYGKDYLGMTGKFHTNWGEFGGFKNPEALRFEIACMAAYGARCSVGDQVHPDGEMDLETYRTIGNAYGYLETFEDYCYDVRETTRLGLMLADEDESAEGVVQMLLEKQMDFDMVMPGDDFSRFAAIIVPDRVTMTEETVRKLQAFAAAGGSVLATGEGLVKDGKFILDTGCTFESRSDMDVDYTLAGEQLRSGIVTTPFLFYEGACITENRDGQVLSQICRPYFNRRYGHYCSHQNAPYERTPAAYPGAVRKGNIVYLAHNVCKMYKKYGCQYHRDYFINALRLIYKDPVMQVRLPSAGRARFVEQEKNHCYCLHLMYGSPIQRGVAQVIEDLPEIRDTRVSVRTEKPVKRVVLQPQNQEIPFAVEEGRTCFTVDSFSCHQLAILEY